MKGIFVGYKPDGEMATYKNEGRSKGEGHLFLSAPPRSGKARDILIPALLHYEEGSCIVIDPKGQLAAVTGPQRARLGQRVIILNPFHILPEVLCADSPEHFGALDERQKQRCVFDAKFNPLAQLDPAAETFGADCDNMAESIVTHDGGDQQTHWSDSARGLVAGLIGHLVANCPDNLRNLTHLRKIITSPSLLCEAAEHAQAEADAGGDPFIAESLARFGETDAANKGEIASIISTANTQTRFLANRAIARCLSPEPDEFKLLFGDLKKQPTTVYLVLPVRYLASCGKWFRLVLASALDALLTEEPGRPVLCVLDECAQLGKLSVIENTLGLAAGMGVQLWPVLQDLTQLKELYPERWESFLGCAGVQMFFAPRENTSANYISELCGETTITLQSESTGKSKDTLGIKTGSTEGQSTNLHQRRAMLAQEIRQLSENDFIMFHDGLPGKFILAKRKPWWRIDECKDIASPDPYHKAGPAPTASKASGAPRRVDWSRW